jgi:hypothetical protein
MRAETSSYPAAPPARFPTLKNSAPLFSTTSELPPQNTSPLNHPESSHYKLLRPQPPSNHILTNCRGGGPLSMTFKTVKEEGLKVASLAASECPVLAFQRAGLLKFRQIPRLSYRSFAFQRNRLLVFSATSTLFCSFKGEGGYAFPKTTRQARRRLLRADRMEFLMGRLRSNAASGIPLRRHRILRDYALADFSVLCASVRRDL